MKQEPGLLSKPVCQYPPRERMPIPVHDGVLYLRCDDILHCGSEGNYTRFHTVQANGHLLISKPLKEVEAMLSEAEHFARIHHRHIVNLHHVEKYLRGDGGEVLLSSGERLPVSREKRRELLERMERI